MPVTWRGLNKGVPCEPPSEGVTHERHYKLS